MKKILSILTTCFVALSAFIVPVYADGDDYVTYTVDSAVFNNDSSSPSALKSFAFVNRDEWQMMTYTHFMNSYDLTSSARWIVVFKLVGTPSTTANSSPSVQNLSPDNIIRKVDVDSSGNLSTTIGTSGSYFSFTGSNGTTYYQQFYYYANRVYDFAYCPYDIPNLKYTYNSGSSHPSNVQVAQECAYFYARGVPSNSYHTYTGRAPFGGMLGLGNINQRMFLSPELVQLVPQIVRNLTILQAVEGISTSDEVFEPASADRVFTESTNSSGEPIINVTGEIDFNVSGGDGGEGGSASQTQTQYQTIEENAVNVTVNNSNNLSADQVQYLDQIINNSNAGNDSENPFAESVSNVNKFISIAKAFSVLAGILFDFLPWWVESLIGLIFSLTGVMVVYRLIHLFI